jgi:hypothetical protein
MTTVHLLLILSLLGGLHSQSVCFTLAFTQAPIDMPTYLDLPIGYFVEGDAADYVLELQKTLYGLRQVGLNWFETLKHHLHSIGFKLEDQGDVVAYLGIDVASSEVDGSKQFKLSQSHLIQQIIKAVNLTDSRLHDTPAKPVKPLGKDSEANTDFILGLTGV